MAGLIQTIVPRLVDFGLGAGQRREEQKRYEEVEKPFRMQQIAQSKAQWGEDGYYSQKLELDKDQLAEAKNQHIESIKQFQAKIGMQMSEEETKRLGQKIDIFTKIIGSKYAGPEQYEMAWNAVGLGDEFGAMKFDTNVPDPNIVKGVSESGNYAYEFTPGKGVKIYDFNKEVSKAGGVKMSDLKTGLTSILTRYKPQGTGSIDLDENGNLTVGGLSSYAELGKQAKSGNEQAQADLMDYEEIWGRMREIAGLSGRLTAGDKYAIDTEEGYRAGARNRLMNVGQPIESQKRIIRTGIDPDTGRKVIMYEDGSVEYAD